MGQFNVDNYETVKERKGRFYADHPDGRIIVGIHNDDLDHKAVVVATVYLCKEDQEKGLPRSTGSALEIRDVELSKSSNGKKYESVNYASWLENCEESAVGRALDNGGYASNGKCSRDEMEKADRNSAAISRSAIPKPRSAPIISMHGGPYRIPFGHFMNKTLEEVPLDQLKAYVIHIEDKAAQDKRPITGTVLDFVSRATEYIGAIENAIINNANLNYNPDFDK